MFDLSPEQITTIVAVLLTVILGNYVSYKNTKKQIRSTVVSANRQEWINKLRKLLATFIGNKVIVWSTHISLHLFEKDLEKQKEHAEHNLEIEFQNAYVRMEIELMLNPNEAAHEKLAKMVDDFGNSDDKDTFDKEIEEITKISQAILKEEWERVKKGD